MGRTSGGGLFFAAYAGLALSLLLALPGCGSDSGAEQAQKSEPAPLTGPVTLTISSPAAVPPLTPVVTTRNSIYFGAGATVVSGSVVALGASGGGIHTEPDGVLNDTWSRGLADLGDRTLVRGTLHAATHKYGNQITPPALDAAPAFEPLNNLTWTIQYPTTGTGTPITANPPPSAPIPPLTPGQYGDVVANSQGSLTFKSGTYYLRSLTFESSSTITLDQAGGPVILYVETGMLGLRGAIKTVTNDPPDLAIIYLGTTAFNVETAYNGALVAPNATATLRAVSGTHTGFFYAKDFQILDAHARVQYRAPLVLVKASNPTTGGGASCAATIRAMVPSPAAAQRAAIARYCGACNSSLDTDRDLTPDCLDGCPLDPLKTEKGTCGCGVSDIPDKDSDGFPNCIDRCPDDPNNIAPGQCGCVGQANLQPNGTPCSDSVGPQANATCNAGVCGDPTTSKPANGCKHISYRSSSYWLCPPYGGTNTGGSGGTGGTGGTGGSGGSGGAGTGGTSGGGTGGTSGGGGGTPLTQSDAQLACSAKGLSLVRVDSLEENRTIQGLITQPIWLGANSITTANNWRWAITNSNNGDQFWSGGVSGTPVGGRFNYWAPGTLSSTDRCVVMLPKTGRWSVVPCNQARGYICEYRTPVTRGAPIKPPGGLGTPPARPQGQQCVTEATAQLPDAGPNGVNAAAAQAQLQGQFKIADEGGTFPGPFLNPSSSGSCPDNPDADGITRGQTPEDQFAGCPYTIINSPQRPCMDDVDCSGLGANVYCRSVNLDPACVPAGTGNECRGRTLCVQVNCPVDNIPCDQIELCNPDSPVVTPSFQDPIQSHPLDPATIFGGQLPNADPTTATWGGPQSDPAHGPNNDQFGTNNAWCKDKPRQPAVADKTLPATDGKTSNSGKIQFGFNPELTFKANPGVLGQGETNLEMLARASLAANVSVNNFLGQSFGPTDIFNAEVGMGLQRCQIFATLQASVFKQKFASPKDFGIPSIDSRSPDGNFALYDAAKTCDDAIGKFQLYADRAKKAFRDAQTLATQYKSATSVGKVLAGNLCNAVSIVGAVDEDFPGGPNCGPNEDAYTTVGRFLDYYQAPGTGQLGALRDAQMALSDATGKLKNLIDPLALGFDGLAHQESETVLSVQFWIGPIPVLLEIDVFAKYGIGGGFELKFQVPTGLVFGDTGPQPVAKVTASVAPYAAAGLSAFVGVGFSLGPLKASIGIEGSLTLASISAPIYAGVGLDVEAMEDKRTIHPDILSVVAGPKAFPFGTLPTALKFSVNYEYGAGIDLQKILEGEVNGKLRIKFFFFSRTWRKNILKFAGLPPQHFDLVQSSASQAIFSTSESVPAHLPTADNKPNTAGTTTAVASGATDTGLAETQVPLMLLALPPLPPATPIDPPVNLDLTNLEKAGYDSLCCAKASENCQTGLKGRPQCCPGLDCVANVPGTTAPADGSCQRQCNTSGTECNAHGNTCCSGLICATNGNCQACGQPNANCGNDGDCCAGSTCDPNTLKCKVTDPCANATCNSAGTACGTCGKSCCEGLQCLASTGACGECIKKDLPCGTGNDCCSGLCDTTGSHTCYENSVPK